MINDINIRKATEEDKEKLPRLSYSGLSTLSNCPYRFFIHYIKGVASNSSTIALDVGSFCHKVLEDKANVMIETNYSKCTHNEYNEEFQKVKSKWWEQWGTVDKSGMNYDQKFESFWNYYPTAIESDIWEPLDAEKEFEFVFEDRVRLYGFIDRVDITKDGDSEIKVTDYKTANHVYSNKETNYSLQMFVYALACKIMYDRIPVEFEYDFVFLNQKKLALNEFDSFKKCYEQLSDLVDYYFELADTRKYICHPTPLCYWCDYSALNPNSSWQTRNCCKYYSLWTPQEKTFKVNQPYDKETFNADEAYSLAEKQRLVW